MVSDRNIEQIHESSFYVALNSWSLLLFSFLDRVDETEVRHISGLGKNTDGRGITARSPARRVRESRERGTPSLSRSERDQADRGDRRKRPRTLGQLAYARTGRDQRMAFHSVISSAQAPWTFLVIMSAFLKLMGRVSLPVFLAFACASSPVTLAECTSANHFAALGSWAARAPLLAQFPRSGTAATAGFALA